MNTAAQYAPTTSPGEIVASIAFAVAAFLAYWAPWITAWRRHVPNVGAVFVVNLFLGWTVIGWIIALAMAVRSVPSVTAAERNL